MRLAAVLALIAVEWANFVSTHHSRHQVLFQSASLSHSRSSLDLAGRHAQAKSVHTKESGRQGTGQCRLGGAKFAFATASHEADIQKGLRKSYASQHFCVAEQDVNTESLFRLHLDAEAVNGAIASTCDQLGRPHPRLVAVSKFQPNSAILAAHAAGQRHFGENYVQEIVGKAPDLPADIRWHFIGQLQSNKAKALVQGVAGLWMVESVHSEKCASALEKAVAAVGRTEPLKVLIQVKTSGEESKSGCEPEEAEALAKHITANCRNLHLAGLMTIGKLGDANPEPYFAMLAECRKNVSQALGISEDLLELSMGMSGDFEKAIRAGSTNVRVGTTIFGSRPAKE